jgi:hypothetical protein
MPARDNWIGLRDVPRFFGANIQNNVAVATSFAVIWWPVRL